MPGQMVDPGGAPPPQQAVLVQGQEPLTASMLAGSLPESKIEGATAQYQTRARRVARELEEERQRLTQQRGDMMYSATVDLLRTNFK